ncbi:MAG TPA: NAD(P)/FAD-dependent oxidoreductase [Gaiellales bacterium]|jgi:dihydrolipoamide dehydrogenase|nr:NAD(P)/FAD-dependent oxidoreductase [Gaiellales bacterium]
MREFDVVVMGAGPAGEVVAGRLAEHGQSVALVEQFLVGGECSYYACMPSKALLRPVDLANEVERVPGLEVGPIDVDAVFARRDDVIHRLDDSAQLPWLEKRKVVLVRGRGRISGKLQVDVDGQEPLAARRAVVVATGSTPLVPDIPGLRESQPWTNRNATTASEVPPRFTILGGGVVAAEMAQAWGALGSKVTVIHRGERLIKREEPFASEQVLESLREIGVDVRFERTVTHVARDGAFTISLDDDSSVEADQLLVAFGRVPGTNGIGLETLGLEEGKPLLVGDDLRVRGHDWLFAIGDVNGRAQLTHMGKYQGRLVADTIIGRKVELRSDGGRSPRVIFTDPQVGAVGLTLAAAQEAGLNVRHVDVETSGNAGGSFVGRGARGTSRLVIDEDRRVVAGATITGAEIAEALHAATIAVVAEVSLDDLWHAVPSFPTRSELWLKLLEAYGL